MYTRWAAGALLQLFRKEGDAMTEFETIIVIFTAMTFVLTLISTIITLVVLISSKK